jgi:ATP phosphoribosyltransferase regulatory subunit
LAKGGRYDQIGADFGRARAATGFSTDLKTLVMLALEADPVERAAILAPASCDAGLLERIRQLRTQGERVVTQLEGAQTPSNCDRQLVKNGTEWVLEAL